MNINFYENVVGYTAGDQIAGTIDLVIKEPFDAKDLTIAFVGVERSHLDTSQVLFPEHYHRESKTVIEMKSTVAVFDEKTQLQPGQYTYYFIVYLPKWLPETTTLKTEKSKFFMEYTIRAQFTPTKQADYCFDGIQDRYKGVSLFRGSRKVRIYKEY